MDPQQIEQFVLKKISAGAVPRQVIGELCELARMDWPDAQALVDQIVEDNFLEIRQRRMPLLLAISMSVIVAGLAVLGGSIALVVMDMDSYLVEDAGMGTVPIVFLLMNYFPLYFQMAAFGVSMIAAGALGAWRTWHS